MRRASSGQTKNTDTPMAAKAQVKDKGPKVEVQVVKPAFPYFAVHMPGQGGIAKFDKVPVRRLILVSRVHDCDGPERYHATPMADTGQQPWEIPASKMHEYQPLPIGFKIVFRQLPIE